MISSGIVIIVLGASSVSPANTIVQTCFVATNIVIWRVCASHVIKYYELLLLLLLILCTVLARNCVFVIIPENIRMSVGRWFDECVYRARYI